MRALTQIRSIAIGKANRIQKAHRHLAELLPAFEAWAAGEIYVCKKTGTYRYRFGDKSKSVTPWDALARKTFPTAAEFAFAAMVLAGAPREQVETAPAPVAEQATEGRANIINLAAA